MGVFFARFLAVTLPPASIRSLQKSRLPHETATCSGVSPSASCIACSASTSSAPPWRSCSSSSTRPTPECPPCALQCIAVNPTNIPSSSWLRSSDSSSSKVWTASTSPRPAALKKRAALAWRVCMVQPFPQKTSAASSSLVLRREMPTTVQLLSSLTISPPHNQLSRTPAWRSCHFNTARASHDSSCAIPRS
ncbi:hypothetical protein T484DRAFT_1939204 [Baffinella frigidus]|nr:hypothetical protein T484DRAFT_1939204 [Cryptophyta sp. CCMP2293]